MKKLGPVLGIAIHPTKGAWEITITHRSPGGGISPVVSTHGKFAGVLAHINNAVDTYGVERP
jgi:hypothetical protein